MVGHGKWEKFHTSEVHIPTGRMLVIIITSSFLYSALHDQLRLIALYNHWLLLPWPSHNSIQLLCGFTATKLPIPASIVITSSTRAFLVHPASEVFRPRKIQPARPRIDPGTSGLWFDSQFSPFLLLNTGSCFYTYLCLVGLKL